MSLEFRHIAHAYGPVRALEDISFTAQEGEITCLLGQSGCGKSTLLNLAAGLLDVQSGHIALAGETLAEAGYNPPPEKRPVGLVFQDGALFPHMTIARNVGFGLEHKGGAVIEGWLDRVGLGGFGQRYPHELSGGQQQRAALARAMAPGPRVLLMDEPFASVDIVLRRALRRECRLLLREQGATTILVTHDPSEALDVADRIAVMESGKIVQFGTPLELHEEPAAASVGAIFSGAQIVRAQRHGEMLRTAFGDWPVECVRGRLPDAKTLDLLVSASDIALFEDGELSPVRDIQPMGEGSRVLLRGADGSEITSERSFAMKNCDAYRATPMPGTVRAFAAK